MSWRGIYKQKLVSADEAANVVKSGDKVYLAGSCSTPVDVVNALCRRYEELQDVELFSGLLLHPFDFFKSEFKGHINYTTLFMGPVERFFYDQGNIKVNSCHFGNAELVVEDEKPPVMLLECSPPNEDGDMSFGIFSFASHAASRYAKKIVVQVNNKTPFIFGENSYINVKDVDFICEKDHDLPVLPNIPITDIEKQIAVYIADHIKDGDTIQLGIGGLANAVGYLLTDKKNLGAHTEMMTESMVELTKMGVITNKKKSLYPGKTLCTFVIAGSQESYMYFHKNPDILSIPVADLLAIDTIAQIDNFISVNNALAVDLTGQVCAESLGHRQYSATGGQLNLVRGSALSKGGKSFIALNAVANTSQGPVSRITSQLIPGSIVTTPRSDTHYVVTEFGVANVRNKSIPDRVKALINIAHPMFRDKLKHEAKQYGLVS